MDATLQTGLAAQSPLIFHAVEVELAGGWLRLINGMVAGFDVDGDPYVGEDADYGALGPLEISDDGIGSEAPTAGVTILPPTNAAAAELAGAAAQGNGVRIWLGALDRATGASIGTPDLIFTGEVDVPKWMAGRSRAVRLDCNSVFERFFMSREGIGLNDATHRGIWGEAGLQFITDVQRQLPWGADTPRAQVVTAVTSPIGLSGTIRELLGKLI